MHESYEYVFSGIVVFIMVTITMAVIFPISFTHVAQGQAYQLQSASQTMVNKLLLTTGFPVSWGSDLNINYSNPAGLKSMGLGTTGRPGTLYAIDPDKVTRLVNSTTIDNPHYIPPDWAAKELGVDTKFGFSFNLKPVFVITSTANTAAKTITVRVKTPETVPIPNVNITAILVRKNTADIEAAQKQTGVTDWNGTAVLSFASADQFSKGAYVILANYYGITTAAVGSFGGIVEGVVVKDKLIVRYPAGVSTTNVINNARNPFYIVGDNAVSGSYSQAGYIVNSEGKTYVFHNLKNLDGDTSGVIFITRDGGQVFLVVAFRPPPLTYETSIPSGVHKYLLTRIVAISGVVYRVEFHLWRLAE